MKNSAEYYKKAFYLLKKEKRYTWNWSAFFFGSLWMLYRRMYLYGFLGSLMCFLYLTLANSCIKLVLETENFLYTYGFFLLLHFILSILYGYFANSLYYRVVNNRIKKGYHLLNEYSPTSVSMVLPGVLISSLFACCSTMLFALIDFFRKPRKSELTKENTVINEENMSMYLEDKENYSLSTFFFFLFLLLLGLGTPQKLIFGNLSLVLNCFEPVSEYEEFEAEKNTLLKTKQDLQNKELNSAIFTIFAPDILENMYLSANNGSEFSKNRLKSYNAMLSDYNKKLDSSDKYTCEIRAISSHILEILRKLITEQRADITNYIVRKTSYDINYISSAMDKVLKIDSKSWEKSMLLMMETSKFKRKSLDYLELAKKGDVAAQSKLGRFYIKGFAISSKGVKFNGEKGLMWLKKASEQNDKTWSGYASARIALVYMNGEAGISQNYKEANKWFEKAVKQGYYPALYDLALNYYEGIGVEKNLEKAKVLLKQAIKKGDKRARKLFDSINTHKAPDLL